MFEDIIFDSKSNSSCIQAHTSYPFLKSECLKKFRWIMKKDNIRSGEASGKHI